MTPEQLQQAIDQYKRLSDRLQAELDDWELLTQQFVEVQRMLAEGHKAINAALIRATEIHQKFHQVLQEEQDGGDWWRSGFDPPEFDG